MRRQELKRLICLGFPSRNEWHFGCYPNVDHLTALAHEPRYTTGET
jgi:hypothetical protein